MTMKILPALAAACALTFAVPAYAQRGHGSQPKAPKAPATHVQGGGAMTHGGGQAHGTTTHGGGSHAPKGPKTTAHGPGTHAAATTTKGGPKTSTPAAGTPATTTTTAAAGTELTPVQQKLQHNTNLSAKLQSRLPAGMTVQDASAGFRNLGQFVAAVNVSNNLGIPFAQLKATMLGDTTHLTPSTVDDSPMSLGQAIHTLRPAVDSEAESRTAVRQADAMVTGTRR